MRVRLPTFTEPPLACPWWLTPDRSFEASARELLYASAERITALGGTISEGPRHFPEYREGYHAIFFFDPDGIKLELSWTPAGTYDWQSPPPS